MIRRSCWRGRRSGRVCGTWRAGALPKPQFQALWLKYAEEMSVADIAQVLAQDADARQGAVVPRASGARPRALARRRCRACRRGCGFPGGIEPGDDDRAVHGGGQE